MRNTKIEWCDATWNPVSGCFHNCEYCYARAIAKRFGGANGHSEMEQIHYVKTPIRDKSRGGMKAPYPYGFDPTFYEYKLDEPQEWMEPQTIFVCSMADLFGEWVPDEWIDEVFNACNKANWHRYLFLTKNPERYSEVCKCYMPPNMWLGWSQTKPGHISFATHHSVNTFISFEPLLESFEEYHFSGVNWAIIGAETGNRKGKVVPEKSWVDYIVKECDREGIPVFMKDSLIPIMGEENMRRDFPWKGKENE